LFQYEQVNNNDQYDNYATIGIENETQTEGLLITYANIYAPTIHEIEDETAILFTTNSDSHVSAGHELTMNIPILHQNYPNPFNPTTTILFQISSKQIEQTKIEIFNIKGQNIKLVNIL